MTDHSDGSNKDKQEFHWILNLIVKFIKLGAKGAFPKVYSEYIKSLEIVNSQPNSEEIAYYLLNDSIEDNSSIQISTNSGLPVPKG